MYRQTALAYERILTMLKGDDLEAFSSRINADWQALTDRLFQEKEYFKARYQLIERSTNYKTGKALLSPLHQLKSLFTKQQSAE
jgi:hypothetical protein